MKRTLPILLSIVFAVTTISLVVVQIVQTRRSIAVSESLFAVTVGDAMDDVLADLNRMKVEDYISQQDRYLLLKYRRVEQLRERMQTVVETHAGLFFDEERVALGTVLLDSARLTAPATAADSAAVAEYNALLDKRARLMRDTGYYRRFVSDVSEYLFDNMLAAQMFQFERLDSLVVDRLEEHGIDLRPRLAVVDAGSGDVLHATDEEGDWVVSSPFRYAYSPSGSVQDGGCFIVLAFPRSELMLRSGNHFFFVASAVLILLAVVSFLFSIRIIHRLRKADAMRTDFVNNMTHELKTPIATVGLAAEMLRDPATDAAQARACADVISNENRRLQVLAETILQVSRMSGNHFQLDLAPVDLHDIVREAVGSFRMAVETRGGVLQLDLQAGQSIVAGDRVHLTNAVYNLVDNAVKYSPDRLEISLKTVNVSTHWVALEVRDRGRGIGRSDQRHIFERFFRVSTGDRHDVKGFGIGLNYVQQVVELHGGRVSVDSTPGVGSTFTVRLPLS